MKDFRIVSARILLKTHSVSPVRGFLPQSVIVLGEELNLAKEIFYNGVKAEEFAVLTPSRIIVRIPENQIGKPLNSVQVTSTVPVAQRDAVLSFAITRPVENVQGIGRLVQCWLMVFMTTPGSDVFTPKSGGGAQAIIGRTTDKSGKGVSADLTLAVERTKTELLALQSKRSNIPLSEKLLATNIESIQFDENTSALSARVSIQNMLGNQAEVSVR